MARPDTEYQITPKGEELAGRLAETRGIKNMMGNPIMSGVKSNPKRVQSQSPETPNTKEKRIKNIPNKEPNFSNIAPGNPRPLKVNDSSADILGKMYNFMIKKADIEKKEFKQERKFKKEQVQVKEDRTQELIGLFKVKKSRKVKEEKNKKEIFKKEETKTEGKKPAKTTKPSEAPTKTETPSTSRTRNIETKPTAEKVSTAPKTSPISNVLPKVTTTTAAVGAVAVAGATISDVVEAGPGYNVVKKPDGSIEKRVGARNWRNNNPGNIDYGAFAKENGAIGSDGRFAIFPSYEVGRKAKEKLIFEGKNYKDLDLKSAIARYAPPSENDTKAYQARVLAAVGGENKKMSSYSSSDRIKIMDAMEKQEGFKVGQIQEITKGTGSRMASNEPTPTTGPTVATAVKITEIPKKEEKIATINENTPISMLNNQTNIINGGTTFASNEDRKEYASLLEKQFYG